ncbi:MAG: rod shape-determining protein MreC [Oscillospiraceae bacterium]
MNKHSKSFKIMVAIIAVILGMAIYAGVNGKLMSIPQEIMGAISVPIKRVTASVTAKISIWQNKYMDIDEIVNENENLKKQVAELQGKQIDYDKIKLENEQYKEFLQIKTEHDSYEVVSGAVIGRDGLDKFYSFTIDQGEKAGVAKNDVVMSAQGVIGVVVETGKNFAKVSTILNPAVNIAAFVSSTRDTGVVMGNSDYSNSLLCTMSYLPKNTKAKVGDIISTTGLGGIFPPDLVIGVIEEIDTEEAGNSMQAVIKPAADIAEARMVFVLTNY